MKLTLLLVLVLCLFGLPPCAHAGEDIPRLTLEECIALGLERSIPLANARRDLDRARMQIAAVRAQAHPHLDLNANYTRLDDVPSYPDAFGSVGKRDTYAASVDAEQVLYAGGSVRAALRIAEHFEDASAWELDEVESDVIRQITRGFYDVLFYQAAVEVAEQSVLHLGALEDQARRRHEAETVSEFEWLSAQVALANERPALIAAQNALILARRTFRDLIHLDQDTFTLDGALDLVPATYDLPELQRQALAFNPVLHQMREHREMAVQQRRVIYSDYLPDIRAFASYGGADPSQRDPFADGWEWEWVAGVRMTWSLFDGGRRRAELRSNNLHIEQIHDELYDLERAVRLNVERHWLMLEEARETLQGTADNIALAERALHIATVRYEQGLATHLDFTDSNLALNRAHLNHNRALRGYRHTWADLKHGVGVRALPDGENQP